LNEEVFVAHLWIQDSKGEWVAMTLNGGVMTLTKDDVYPASIGQNEKTVQGSVFIKSWQHVEEKIWLVMAGRGTRVWVNGRLLQTGIRVLQDRDDVRVHDQLSVFFSAEQLARVRPYTPGAASVFCPRCKQPLVDGTPSVQCPQCGVWEHQDDDHDLGCWMYSETCAVCDQPTDLHSGFRWTPERL
jgi:hypothetical protein